MNAADETQSLSGASFTITRNPYAGAAGTAVTRTESYTTGDDGTVTIPNLPYGDYELTETAAPSGYQIFDSPIRFSVDYLGQITSTDDRLVSLSGSAADGYSAVVRNVPNPVTLTVTKNLEGSAKNAADTFLFTLSAEDYPDYVTDSEKVSEVSRSIGQGGVVSITVPSGTTVRVTETDSGGYSASVETPDGQTPVLTDWTADGDGYSGTLTLTEDTAVAITNTKDMPVVTGFVSDASGTGGIVLVGLTLISLCALLFRKRKRA